MSWEMILAIGLGLVAIVMDLWKRSIPNWIPVAALAGGLGCQAATGGWRGAGSALLGAAAGFGIFLVFYLLGGLGGGDVKLMAGFGALLGIHRVLLAALWVALFGGLMAVAVLGGSWLRRKLAAGPRHRAAPKTIPYAPAIAFGVWVALMVKR